MFKIYILWVVSKINVLIVEVLPEAEKDPCVPNPCGPNAECKNGQCACIPEYHGDPFVGCRPECTINDECSSSKACLRNKCVDPCPGSCGLGAICEVHNHIVICTCPQDMTGNPFVFCRPFESKKDSLNTGNFWCNVFDINCS